MDVSADLRRRGEQNLPSTKTGHIRGWRWHRQECQLVWFVGRHGGRGGGVGGKECVSRVTWSLSSMFWRVRTARPRLELALGTAGIGQLSLHPTRHPNQLSSSMFR